MAIGSLWLVCGIAITVGTYSATNPGDKFLLTYGALIFGVINLGRG